MSRTKKRKQTQKPPQTFYMVERMVKQSVLISTDSEIDARAQSRSLPEYRWVQSPDWTAPVVVTELEHIMPLKYFLRRDQPHLCVCWDEKYIGEGEANYDEVIYGTNSLKKTYHEAYVPYDAIMWYGLNRAFCLVSQADPLHIVWYKSEEYYTHNGDEYEGECSDIILYPDELVDHEPNH